MGKRTYTQDADLILKDLGALTASSVGQVGGQNVIRDLGGARFEGVAIVDVSAVKISAGNETYRILIQGSNSASFASGIINLAGVTLGPAAIHSGGAGDSVAGRYEIPFINEQADTVYRYLRANVVIGGTSPDITSRVWVGERY